MKASISAGFAKLTAMLLAQARDAARVREFVLEHKPHVILVGGANLWCRALREDLGRVRDHILDTMPRALTRSDTGDIDVRLADETLAAAWAASAAAISELPEQPPLVRRAVRGLLLVTVGCSQHTPVPSRIMRDLVLQTAAVSQ